LFDVGLADENLDYPEQDRSLKDLRCCASESEGRANLQRRLPAVPQQDPYADIAAVLLAMCAWTG